MPPIRIGFEPQNFLNHGSQIVTVPLEMGSFLNQNKNFLMGYLSLLLDFLGLSCDDWFVVTLPYTIIPLQ